MNKSRIPIQLIVVVAVCALAVTVSSWQTSPSTPKQVTRDTVPEKNKKIRDIDEAIEELNKSKAEVEQNIKEIDFDKLEKEIHESLKNVQIDKEKVKADIDKALKDIDTEKMQKEINESLAKIDMEKVKAEVQKLQDVDLPKMEAELRKMKPQLEQSIKAAQEGIEKARKEMQGYKNLIDGLDKEGLIQKNGSYTITYQNGTLTVNGKLQPASVINKYAAFLSGHKDFTIKKDGDDFDIKNP